MSFPLRRLFMTGGVAAVVSGFFALRGGGPQRVQAATPAEPAETFEITHTEDEWRKLLSANQFAVLRKEGTERPFSSPLNDEHRSGQFSCAACKLALFSSKTKFDSGTGWPSFWQPLEHAVGEHRDRQFGMVRTEVHCSRCGGHLGHVFDDGPRPTGLRYCMNGIAMEFVASSA